METPVKTLSELKQHIRDSFSTKTQRHQFSMPKSPDNANTVIFNLLNEEARY